MSETKDAPFTYITSGRLAKWIACEDGAAWFAEQYPQGGEYIAVTEALRNANRHAWAEWLSNALWSAAVGEPAQIAPLVATEVADAIAVTAGAPNSSSGHSSKAASSGDYSKAASSGYYSTAASSGYYSTAASSGYSSKAASSGDYSTAASSGYYSKAASSGYSSTAASSGKDTIAMVAGINGRAKAGPDGCIALCWHDGTRNRIVTGYIGEDGIEADTWYRVEGGKLVQAHD